MLLTNKLVRKCKSNLFSLSIQVRGTWTKEIVWKFMLASGSDIIWKMWHFQETTSFLLKLFNIWALFCWVEVSINLFWSFASIWSFLLLFVCFDFQIVVIWILQHDFYNEFFLHIFTGSFHKMLHGMDTFEIITLCSWSRDHSLSMKRSCVEKYYFVKKLQGFQSKPLLAKNCSSILNDLCRCWKLDFKKNIWYWKKCIFGKLHNIASNFSVELFHQTAFPDKISSSQSYEISTLWCS